MVSFNYRFASKSTAWTLGVAAVCLALSAKEANAESADETNAPIASTASEQTPATSGDPTSDQLKPKAEQDALPAVPRLHHAPPAVARANQALSISADIEHPQLVKRALLVFLTTHDPKPRELEFRRSAPGPYVAVVPANEMEEGTLSYMIEIERLDGKREAVFASRGRFHRVQIPEVIEDARERALFQRLGGRRSVFAGSAEYVDFGTSEAEALSGAAHRVRDRYYRIEGSYTYRPLRFVSEFSIRVGVVRGNSPVPFQDELAPGETEDERFKVGLNYGAPTVRFRVNDIVHLEALFLTSVTEVGFSVGGGGAIHIGDPYGSKLSLGFETIQTFGTRLFSRMDIPASRRLSIAPIIEITDMPHASRFGVRLLGEVTADLGHGLSVAGRGGYQSRLFTEGGASAGATVAYAF